MSVQKELYRLIVTETQFDLTAGADLKEHLANTNEVIIKRYSKTQMLTTTMGELARKELHDKLDQFLNELKD
jgi:hypothetical protein